MNRLSLLLILLLFPPLLFAQEKETDFGGILSIEATKRLNRSFALALEEEVRLITNDIGFQRSTTSIGVDYSFWENRMKLGAYYAFIYRYNDDRLFEPRHRYYFNLSLKETFGSYTLSWRGRFQSTYRDESIGEYKTNPKYVLKNRLEVEYSIFGSPWLPYLSCELSNELNNPLGNELTRLRFQGGTTWRLNRTDYLDFYLRWDEYLVFKDPRVISVGVGFKRRF